MKTRASRWMTWILKESAAPRPAAPFARAGRGGARAALRARALSETPPAHAARGPEPAPHRIPA